MKNTYIQNVYLFVRRFPQFVIIVFKCFRGLRNSHTEVEISKFYIENYKRPGKIMCKNFFV